MTQPKRITPAEFRAAGLLQEVNRQFLHPLGLALEVIAPADGKESPVSLEKAVANVIDAFGRELEFADEYLSPMCVTALSELILAHERSTRFGGVWDYRDDPEGIGFGREPLNVDAIIEVDRLRESKREAREKLFGAAVQPVDRVLAFSALGREMTGLPIDFQIQQQSYANEKFEKSRNSLGMVPWRFKRLG